MNKNNLFLIAFIIYIMICGIIRCFWEYPLWPEVVAAVTTASWIFAFADLFYSSSKLSSSLVEACIDFPDLSNGYNQKIKRDIDICLNSSQPCIDSDLIKHLASCKNDFIDIEEKTKKLSETIRKEKKEAQKYEVIGHVCTVVGFLTLLCIMTFEPISAYFVDKQELMTVCAFGLILFTQLREETKEKQTQKIRGDVKWMLDSLEPLQKSFETEVRKCQEKLSVIDN